MERPDLAAELERLAEDDLTLRQQLLDRGELVGGYHPEMRAVHRANGDRLTEILDELGAWPGHHLVGEAGAEAAFLIAQHDIANPHLLRRSSRLLADAVGRGDAVAGRLAMMEDRIRYFEGRPQLFGTHLGWDTEGDFGPWPPIEDADRVEERRASVGLPPLADALAAAGAGRPLIRPIDEILDDHRRADDFARASGWRDRPD